MQGITFLKVFLFSLGMMSNDDVPDHLAYVILLHTCKYLYTVEYNLSILLQVHQSGSGWSPVFPDENLALMSIGFLLGSKDDAVIWRGPRKNGWCDVMPTGFQINI